MFHAGCYAAGNGGMQAQAAVRVEYKLFGGGIDTGEHVACIQRRQDGAQRIVQREHVRLATARRDRQDDFAGQAILRQQIEEGLEDAAARRLVDRRCDDDGIGRCDSRQRLQDGRVLEVGTQQGMRGQVAHGQRTMTMPLERQLVANMS